MARLITLEEIEDGMVLSSPAKNKFGQVLLGAGLSLTQKHKGMLKTWGVTMLQIVDDAEIEAEKSFSEAMRDDAAQKLRDRFRWSPENDYEKDLFDMALKSLLEKSY